MSVGNNPLLQEKARCDAWTVSVPRRYIDCGDFLAGFWFQLSIEIEKKKKKKEKTQREEVLQSDRNLCQKLFVPNSRLLHGKLIR